MSNPAYQNYLTELQNFVNAIGKDSAQDKSGSYSGPRDSNGQPNGVGKMIYDGGSVYEGQFLHGLKNGKGIYTWPNGNKYEGEWKDNKMDGKGIYNWPDGKRYEGEWKDGNMNGKGIKTWPDGTRYEGEWKDDKRDGKGILTYADGKKQSGVWKGVIRVTGQFVWNNHPGFTFLFEPAFGQENILIAKCKKIGSERFYTYDQIVFENVEIKSDLSIKGKVLVPGPGWQDFEGTVAANQIIIYIGEPRWHWSFKQVD